jgi:hypothetical protein
MVRLRLLSVRAEPRATAASRRVRPSPRQAAAAVARRIRRTSCTGRVVWVTQRLDLSPSPPFAFDVGIELVKPPAALGPLVATARRAPAPADPAPRRGRELAPADIRGRRFAPHLKRDAAPPGRWHLVVWQEGVPCFSGRFPSEPAALAAWARFKRQQTPPKEAAP